MKTLHIGKNQSTITSNKIQFKKEIYIMKPNVNMTGRLTRDVTNIFSNQDGTAKRCLLTIACNSYYKGQDGTKKESVDFIPCIAWGEGRVNTLSVWGKKGRHMHIFGTLEAFQAGPDNNGKYPPTKIQVRIEQFEFLDKKPEGIEAPAQAPAAGTPSGMDMVKLAEMVAAKLLGATNLNATPADPVNEETANQAASEEAANAQAASGGDLGSVT
jgi:single-stranded DNA-binding protein